MSYAPYRVPNVGLWLILPASLSDGAIIPVSPFHGGEKGDDKVYCPCSAQTV